MLRKTLICLLVIALLATGLLTACGTTTVTQTNTTTVVNTVTSTATTTGNIITTPPTATTTTTTKASWWDQYGPPVYGGTLNMRAWPGLDQMFYDPYLQSGFGGYSAFGLCYENPFYLNWYIDRTINPIRSTQENNLSLVVGALIDTWDMPDPLTVVAHVRDGVRWWNRPPANGRELVAGDIVAHYARILGWDGGAPNPSFTGSLSEIESVTAPDDDTVIYKLKHANFIAYCQTFIEQTASTKIEYPLGENVMDADHMIGTGAYWVKSEVPGASITFERNPDYWAYDERYPENQLPYFDEVKVTAIMDMTTAMTALRTGQLDMLGMLDWRQAENLANSNPELKQSYSTTMGYGLRLRADQPPFDDINLRKALQMAIDLPLLAETHYGGTVSPDPAGIGTPNDPGWYTPFNEWPADLKAEYTYNPEAAIALLDDAGYSPSKPLEFSTTAEATADLDQLQILQSMFAEVGFKMNIQTINPGGMFPTVGQKLHQTVYFYTTGMAFPKQVSILWFSPTRSTFKANFNDGSVVEGLIDKFFTTTTEDEARAAFLAVEQYSLSQHWDILTVCPRSYTVWSPNLMGYSGEPTNINSSNWIPKIWEK